MARLPTVCWMEAIPKALCGTPDAGMCVTARPCAGASCALVALSTDFAMPITLTCLLYSVDDQGNVPFEIRGRRDLALLHQLSSDRFHGLLHRNKHGRLVPQETPHLTAHCGYR